MISSIERLLPAVILFAVLGQPTPARADEVPHVPDPYVAEFDGWASVHCQCLATPESCALESWAKSGAVVQEWWQAVSVVKDRKMDLLWACYGKRELPEYGAGACCAVTQKDGKPERESLRRIFGVSEVKPGRAAQPRP